MDENTLNDLLECSVCLERLDTSSKVLPCQHTFCRKCLEVIYASRQELRCPECRVLVDTKIDELPPNVLLMRILEGMKNAAATKQHAQVACHESIDIVSEQTNRPMASSSHLPPLTASNEERARQQQHQLLQHQIKLRTSHNAAAQFQQQQNFQSQNQQQPPPLQMQQQQHHQLQQQRRCIVPHAYALYDFDSNEPTDLKFKKGDLILLRRKIDSNWYVGQLKGVEGNFPLNYVQVVVPLPTSQCVALYDFKMGPNEEEGCLTFKKGTLIQVLRRVDHNWAEGRIGSAIGIFPIAFVELNHLAKQLLEGAYVITSASNQQQAAQGGPQPTQEMRTVPPIPTIDCIATSNAAEASLTSSTALSAPTSCSSSSNSSATTSPTSTTANPSSSSSSTTTSSLNTVFHSMPNSPQSSGPTTPQHSAHITNAATSSVRLRNNDLKHKRHSLNALLNNGATALSIMQTNRHSAEILSVPNDFEHELDTTAASATGQTTVAREQQHHTSNLPMINSSQHSPQAVANHSQAQATSNATPQTQAMTPRHNVLKTCVQQNIPPSLPWGYLALYPYKPRKNDELELKKGCVYMVTERCLDGWFKGKNWKDISGVFPGNYVTPLRARDQQQLMHSWKLIPPSNYPTTTNAQQLSNQTTTASVSATSQLQQQQSNYSISMRNDLENINARLTLANLTPHQAMPPDLPPRQLAVSPTTVNLHQQQLQPAQQQISAKENRDKEALKEKPTSTGCMSTSSSSSAATNTTTSSASAGLKKFLTHIKSRSKSPGAAIAAAAAVTATTNANNASAKQTQIGSTLTAVHVRSGSCPSQLLQTFPNEMSRGAVNENKTAPMSNASQQQPQQTSPNYGSQRIKGAKERPSLDNSRPTIDSTLRSIYANHIQQQSALMPKKCGQQYQQPLPAQAAITTNFNSSTAVVHRKSHSLDASNILQTSPPLNAVNIAATSSSSLIGGGAAAAAAAAAAILKPSVPQCNINAAAIHASATTKSAQNSMSESRFRCVVPYPPNSDIELELQVGDIIFVYRKQKNGWYKGTNSRTHKTGLFPASFVEPDL